MRAVIDAIFGDDDREEPKSELKEAIEKAEKEQKRLEEILSGAATDVKATLGVVSLIVGEPGDDELAGDITD